VKQEEEGVVEAAASRAIKSLCLFKIEKMEKREIKRAIGIRRGEIESQGS
jgi:hypothetical protein